MAVDEGSVVVANYAALERLPKLTFEEMKPKTKERSECNGTEKNNEKRY